MISVALLLGLVVLIKVDEYNDEPVVIKCILVHYLMFYFTIKFKGFMELKYSLVVPSKTEIKEIELFWEMVDTVKYQDEMLKSIVKYKD